MAQKNHQWISAREHRFIKKCARDKRLKSVSSTQMGIIVGHSRGTKPISRHTINRVKNKPMRLPKRKKPGPKTRFSWCEDYLVRLVKHVFRVDGSQPELLSESQFVLVELPILITQPRALIVVNRAV